MNLITKDLEEAIGGITATYLICDLELNIVFANKSANLLFSNQNREITGKKLLDLKELPDKQDLLRQLELTSKDGFSREFIAEQDDSGKTYKFLLRKVGELISLELFDLTEMQELRQSEQLAKLRKQGILDSIDLAAISIDYLEKNIIKNELCQDYFGDLSNLGTFLFQLKPRFVQNDFNQVARAPESGYGILQELIKNIELVWYSGEKRQEHFLLPLDNDSRIIEVNIFRWIFEDKPRGIFLTGRDVTKEVAFEDIQIRREQLVQIQKFAQGISHDFGNLSQSIAGFTKLLIPKIEDPELHIVAQNLKIAAERAIAISHKISEISRIQLLENQNFDLLETLRLQIPFLKEQLGPNINLDLQFEDDLSGDVFANPDQIERIIQNIVENASHAMSGIGQINIKCYGDDEKFNMEIGNSGPAIPKHIAEKIFMPFVTGGKVGGTGLGLYLAYEYLATCGGNIELFNHNKDVTFKITLPKIRKGSELSVF